MKGNKSAKSQTRPRRGGVIPVIAVAAHKVHPVQNQRISSSTGTEKKNIKNHLTMKMQIKKKKEKEI